jgi:hypothetical protein
MANDSPKWVFIWKSKVQNLEPFPFPTLGQLIFLSSWTCVHPPVVHARETPVNSAMECNHTFACIDN